MGSGNSRLGSSSSRGRAEGRRKRGLGAIFCGYSRSQAPLDGSDDERDFIVEDNFQSSAKESLPLFSSENESSSSMGGSVASSRSNNGIRMEESSGEYVSRSYRSSNGILMENSKECASRSQVTIDAGLCLSKSKELVPSEADAVHSTVKSHWENSKGVASTSKEREAVESTSTNGDTRLDTITDVDDSRPEERCQICTDGSCSSGIPCQEFGHSYANGLSSIQRQAGEIPGLYNSEMSSVLIVSDSSLSSGLLGDESHQEVAPPSNSGSLPPTTRQSDRSGSMLHVDVLTLSSDILPGSTGETSSREARQNSRRTILDAFSRRSSRRNGESQTIVFSTEGADDVGSYQRRVLDFSGNLFENGIGDLGYLSSRNHNLHERQWHSRSEIWERLDWGLDERRGRTTCASGLHPDGTCSCETFLMSGESDTRGSISRIVMIAEALFEILDEIHRQPMPLSFSIVSLPAPESLVDSFPLKSYEKTSIPENGDDVEQCYICLAEYDEGDKIRVLPCRHEFHMLCVDKWLKEIHGVCPLCRGDVCEGITVGSVSNS